MGEAFRLSVEQFQRMGEAGILGEDDRIELIEGGLYRMAPIGPLHLTFVNRLTHLLVERLGVHAIVSVQNPVALPPDSMPSALLGPLKNLRRRGFERRLGDCKGGRGLFGRIPEY